MKIKLIMGMALLEILISLIIISSVIFTLFEVKIQCLRHAKVLLYKVIAENQLCNLASIIENNCTNFSCVGYLGNWSENTKKILPKGNGKWQKVSEFVCELTVSWVFVKKQQISLDALC